MVMFQTGNEKVPDMLTSRQNLKFFLDLFANFLNFARAHDGHSSFTFKSTINIKFVFLYLILSVHNVWKGGGGGGGGVGGGDRQCEIVWYIHPADFDHSKKATSLTKAVPSSPSLKFYQSDALIAVVVLFGYRRKVHAKVRI